MEAGREKRVLGSRDGVQVAVTSRGTSGALGRPSRPSGRRACISFEVYSEERSEIFLREGLLVERLHWRMYTI